MIEGLIMSCVIVDCCTTLVDLDYNCDDVVLIGMDYWHGECAVEAGKISEKQWESGENEF